MSGPVGREQSREDIWRGPTQNGKYGRKRGEISEVFRVYSERGTRRMNYGLTLLYGFSRPAWASVGEAAGRGAACPRKQPNGLPRY